LEGINETIVSLPIYKISEAMLFYIGKGWEGQKGRLKRQQKAADENSLLVFWPNETKETKAN
jgi:hypothetical protein